MTTQAPIVDTHIHLWKLPRTGPPMNDAGVFPPADIGWMHVDCLVEDYMATAGGERVDKIVVIEASGGTPVDKIIQSNQWMLRQVKASEKLLSVVGRLDVTQPTADFTAQLDQLAGPTFVGLRIGGNVFQADAEPGLESLKPDVLDNLREMSKWGLMLDTLGIAAHGVAELAHAVPEMSIVMNHWAGKPQTFEVERIWRAEMEVAAAEPNIHLKVSDTHRLSTTAVGGNWPAQFAAIPDPDRYVRALTSLWKMYGEDRLMFGTNWPVSEVGALETSSIELQINILETFLADKSKAVRSKAMHDNAMRVYGPRG